MCGVEGEKEMNRKRPSEALQPQFGAVPSPRQLEQ